VAAKMSDSQLDALQVHDVAKAALESDRDLVEQAAADMLAVDERDPACRSLLQPFLYFKGFHALLCYRIAHRLWRDGRDSLAFHMQSRMSERFGVDIHPAAQLGRGIMIDHATSVVIGETAVVGDNVSILHEVTLGGTGADGGDRHPKIGNGVLIGAGAKVLGNITVGAEARIAAGSVVLADVPSRCTVAGVPAKPVGGRCAEPSRTMDQTFASNGEDS
jgi:serine O-acetyltransferase